MLTKMSIEGYKPFGKKQTFRLAPITLVYGPNSGGKSSLLEAIQILLASHEKGMVVPGLDHVGPSANLLHSWPATPTKGGHRSSEAAIHGMWSQEQGRGYGEHEGGGQVVVDVYGLVKRTRISRTMGFVCGEPQHGDHMNQFDGKHGIPGARGEFKLDVDLILAQGLHDAGPWPGDPDSQPLPPFLVRKYYLDPNYTSEVTAENAEEYGIVEQMDWLNLYNRAEPALVPGPYSSGGSGHILRNTNGPPQSRVFSENGYWEYCKENQLDPGTQKTLRLIDDELLWEIVTKTAPDSEVITHQFVEEVVKDIVSNLRFDIPAHQYCWDGDPESPTLELLYLAIKYCEAGWWKVSKQQVPDDFSPSYSKLHEYIDSSEDGMNTHPYCLGFIHLPYLDSYTFLDPPDSRAEEFSSLRAKLESEKGLGRVLNEDPEANAFIFWLTTVLPLDPRCRTFPATSGSGVFSVVPDLRPAPMTWWASSEYPYHDAKEESVSECFSMLGLEYKFRSKDSHHDDIGPGSSAILVDRQGREINLRHTGTGISQVLPVVAALASNIHLVLLKQPELHLHPRQQGDLADVLIWSVRRSSALMHKKSISASNAHLPEDHETAEDSEWTEKEISKFTPAWGDQVIAETHSEMLIYRLQRRIREGTLSPREVSILYVEPMDDGASVVRELRLRPDGTFIDEWPGGFFEDDFAEFFGESPDVHGADDTLSEEEGD